MSLLIENVFDQPIDSDIKQYEEIRKIITGHDEDLSIQKELVADPKAIQWIEFVGQLKNLDGATLTNKSMFF